MGNEYEYILAIADQRSLLRAAERLYITPSALSQFVARVEKDLATPLFIRSRQGWVPTAAGQIYIEMARRIVVEQRRAHAQISLISTSAMSSLTIGISSGQPSNMLANLLPVFSAHFPNVKIYLIEGLIHDIVEDIRQNKIDLGFVNTAFPVQGIQLEEINSESFVAIVPRKHPMSCLSNGTVYPLQVLERFRDSEFLMMKAGTTLRKAEDELFQLAGFEPRIIFESSSTQTIYTLAWNGYAPVILPSSYATVSPEATSVLLDCPLPWRRYAGYALGRRLSPTEMDIIRLARSYYQRLHEQQLEK